MTRLGGDLKATGYPEGGTSFPVVFEGRVRPVISIDGCRRYWRALCRVF